MHIVLPGQSRGSPHVQGDAEGLLHSGMFDT